MFKPIESNAINIYEVNEMTPEERRARQRAWRAANPDKIAKYREKARLGYKERYARNRDMLIEKAKARYRADPERARARQRPINAKAHAMARERAASIERMFELLPEGHRAEYAEWLLLLADYDTSYASVLRMPRIDYGLMAVYIEM